MDPLEALDCLSNAFLVQGDWLAIPYGDHPHAQGIQRLDRAAAQAMASHFSSFAARLGRLFGGVPIYVGHPDDPRLANQFTDRKAYGWIMALEARDDGLYLQTKWSAAGQELLSNAHYKWFSPYWGCKPIANENGRAILTPVRLVSVGLTNQPNIQGIPPLANEEDAGLPTPDSRLPIPDSRSTPNPKGDDPMKAFLITLLGLANEATDEQIHAAANKLKAAAAAAEAALANEKTARTAAETALANEKTARADREKQLADEVVAERKARIELLLDNAISAGKITPAQRPQWASDLDKDFAAKTVELSNAKPALHTAPATGSLGARNANAQAARDATLRRDKVIMLVNERISKTGEAYEQAFAAIRKEHAALFDEMQHPAAK